jgi:hypothetical protein
MFDAEAAKLSRFLATNELDEPLGESTVTLDGSAIEKWALKTFFNLGYLRGLHREQSNRLDPPAHLVRYVYQNTTVPDGVGLYFVTGQISTDDFGPGLWWNVIRHPERQHEIFGMACTFFGIRFVISIPPFRHEANAPAWARSWRPCEGARAAQTRPGFRRGLSNHTGLTIGTICTRR